MAINLETKVTAGITAEALNQGEVKPIGEAELAAYTASYKDKLRQLPEVERMTGEICIDDPSSILHFGQKATEGISKVSDNLLANMKGVKTEDASEMIVQLTKVMDKFDIKELKDIKEPSALKKLFNKAKNSVEELFRKYETMGTEVDKIYILLKKYEDQIETANQGLHLMYDSNMEYYHQMCIRDRAIRFPADGQGRPADGAGQYRHQSLRAQGLQQLPVLRLSLHLPNRSGKRGERP